MEPVDIEKIPSELVDSYNEQSIYFAQPPLTIELQEVEILPSPTPPHPHPLHFPFL
jgi:hypothetical protein